MFKGLEPGVEVYLFCDCDTSKNTCAQIEEYYNADMPDLIENYMDYAGEDCMNMFTQGQVDLMRNVILGTRIGLIQEPLSIKAENANIEVNVFPNPATDHIVCRVSQIPDSRLTLRILNLNGQVLLQKYMVVTKTDPEARFSTESIAPGLYIVEVRTDQFLSTKRILLL